MLPMFSNMARSYGKFPSLKPPLLAIPMQTLPDELTRACLIAAMVIVAFMGLLTAWLVRPRDRWADAGSGLATGLVAGMAVFAFGFGSAVIVAFSVVATLPDAATLTDGYQTKTPPPSEENRADILKRNFSNGIPTWKNSRSIEGPGPSTTR